MEIKRNELGTYFYFKCKNDFKKGTIVFIHGWGTNSEYHNNFIKYIENEYDYIAIQLPGFGVQEWDKTNKKPKTFDLFLYCINLLREINLDKFYLIGHSMGGGIAVKIANIFRKNVVGLILVTPTNSKMIPKIPKWKIINGGFKLKTFKQYFKWLNLIYLDLLKTFENDHEKIKQLIIDGLKFQKEHRNLMSKIKKSIYSHKNLKQLKNNENQINCPTLVLAGKYDKIINPKSLFKTFGEKQIENLDENKALIKIELMDKSAHMPFHEQEKEYAKEIKDFINQINTNKKSQ